VGLLAWLGIQQEGSFPNLQALLQELRKALPNDEPFVLRYIAIVVVLLGKVASVDGRFSDKEEEQLRALLRHVEGLDPSGIEAVCAALRGKLPSLQEAEEDRCYRELKALCNAEERTHVMRLLVRLAAADGSLSSAEQAEIQHIAEELGVPVGELMPALEGEAKAPTGDGAGD
jgi:uncharacterized tellurite resistance protein B-like protein